MSTALPHLRRTPQQARSRDLVERVLDAARRVLEDDGVEGLTVKRIAEAAGVAVGSLYQYFPDKGAIVKALATRYMDEFEAVVDALVDRAGDERWDDPAAVLIDAYAARYSAEPAYRALWFGRQLTDELREADRRNNDAIADGVRRVLVAQGLARDGQPLRLACRAAVIAADALLQAAFRADPDGDPELLGEAKAMLAAYLAQLTGRSGIVIGAMSKESNG